MSSFKPRYSNVPLSALKKNKSANESICFLKQYLKFKLLKVEIFLKLNTILKELNEVEIFSKQEEDISMLTESSLNVSRAFEADLSFEDTNEKNLTNILFTPLSKFYMIFFFILLETIFLGFIIFGSIYFAQFWFIIYFISHSL